MTVFRKTAVCILISVMALTGIILSGSIPVSASAAAGDNVDVVDYGADKTGKADSSRAFQAALDIAKYSDAPVTVRIPAGNYRLDQSISVWSNTTVIATGAVITFKGTADGNMINGMHFDSNGSPCTGMKNSKCDRGAYNQEHDITIDGGTWNRNSAASCNSFVLTFIHSRNITLKNAAFMNATNHLVNLSGSKDIVITNCTFKNNIRYTGSDHSFWGSVNRSDSQAVKKRYAQLEAVHLDFLNAKGEPSKYRSDGTPCSNIRISGCTFSNVGAGAGTHHEFINDKAKYKNCGRASGLVISGCRFENIWGQMANFCSYTGSSISNCSASSASAIARVSDGSASVSGISLSGRDGDVGPTIFVHNHSTANISNVVINGKSNRGSKNSLIYADTGSTVTASKVTLSNSSPGKPAIGAANSSKITVLNSRISNSGQTAVYGKKAKGVVVKNTVISSSKDNGIYVHSSSGIVLQNNTISSAKKNGIYLESCTGKPAIKGNKIKSSKACGISLKASKKVTISNNQLSGNKNMGIYVFGPSKKKYSTVSILRNTVKQGKSKYAIYLQGYCKSCKVKSNRVGGKGYAAKSKYKVKASGNKKIK
ncbi:MAG: right-handed parallel beta-helix repeat-containing protein [Mogibacterium sp.]|nr:right-handed parallel beta-helix repeat-containing protein [Mogibacterium sp.]